MQTRRVRFRTFGRRGAVVGIAMILVVAGACSNDGDSEGSADNDRETFESDVDLTLAPDMPPSGGIVTELDLDALGYEASEVYVSGVAHSYHNVEGEPFTTDGEWSVEPDEAPTPAFTTRIHVAKPADPDRFDGTVYVEWMNATSGRDGPAAWGMGHVEFADQGAAYVGVSAQQVVVDTAVDDFPDRYGPEGADLVHPGDSYSYDIFTQVGLALRAQPEEILGVDYEPEHVIATGQSQSAGRLATYVNAFGNDPGIYDGYFLHSRVSMEIELRGDVEEPPGLAAIVAPTDTLIRSDLMVPVFTFQTESDSREIRQDDSDVFRLWEVAGTAHADASFLDPGSIATDDGTSSAVAERLFDFMLEPLYQADVPGITLPPCTYGINAGPQYWVVQAALRHLHAWATEGEAPPTADRLATEGDSPSGALIVDEHGNALGGIRSPHLDVPVATLTGAGNEPGFCGLFGTTVPFTADTLALLHPDHEGFVSAWNDAVDAGVEDGFIRTDDAGHLRTSAETSTVGT